MKILRRESCRGDGRFYTLVTLDQPKKQVSVAATARGRTIPVDAYPYTFDGTGRSAQWVVVAPYLSVPALDLSLSADGEAAAWTTHLGSVKWESRINYRLRKDLALGIRDYEQGFVRDRYQLRMLRYLPQGQWDASEHIVWRLEVIWQGAQERPALSLLDGQGQPVDATSYELLPLEFQPADPSDPGALCRTLYSLVLPASWDSFCVVASSATGGVASGFCAVDPQFASAMKYDTWRYMRDARADDGLYRRWFESHRAHAPELLAQRAATSESAPLVSVIVPCYETDERWLGALLDSVIAQSYQRWELVLVDASGPRKQQAIERLAEKRHDPRIRHLRLNDNRGIGANSQAGVDAAQGELLAFVDHDDLIEPDALYRYVEAWRQHPDAALLYCDEDLIDAQGRYGQPVFKTRLDRDLLYSHNCVTHLMALPAATLKELDGFDPAMDGAQDYDMTLRALETGRPVIHVPHVLYHWRVGEGSTAGDNAGAKAYAKDAGRRALQAHMNRRGIAARVEDTDRPFVYRVRYDVPEDRFVSIVIPTRDHADVLEPCVRSILKKATYSRYEVVLVENGSVEPRTFALYDELSQESTRVRIVNYEGDGDFNYSRLINFGVSHCVGDRILLLNNDTEVITPDFLEEMLGYLERPEVGIVGAKLWFRDKLVQHAGILIGPGDAVAHANQDFGHGREGYLGRAVRPSDFSAVTGACQMMRRDTFEKLAGYDESFAVGFNDIDFCLRAAEVGLLTVFTPYAELYHYEFTSRGRELASQAKFERWKREQARFIERWPRVFLDGDPFLNPNLSRQSQYYALPGE